jgi:hypothetical protein
MTISSLPLDRADLPAGVDRAAETGERVLLTRDGQRLPPSFRLPTWPGWRHWRMSWMPRRCGARAEWERGGRRTVPLGELVRELGLDA